MNSAHNFGKKAEISAREYLQRKNYEILDTNWRYSNLEVDIFAKKNNFLIVVEVKARKNIYLNFDEIVSQKKQNNLVNATEKYLEEKNIDLEVRFDVIFVTNSKINHIKDAFSAI